MKVLVVDSNRTFARKTKEFLEQHGRNMEVDTADNIHILRDRLSCATYDFIIADVVAACDPSLLMAELNNCHIPKLVWSMVPDLTALRHTITTKGRVVNKPANFEGLEAALSPLMKTVSSLCDG